MAEILPIAAAPQPFDGRIAALERSRVTAGAFVDTSCLVAMAFGEREAARTTARLCRFDRLFGVGARRVAQSLGFAV